MDDIAAWLIQGIPIGCIYGLVAVGLVLTYKTSGVFNLAFSGQAFFCAWFWYDRVVNHGWPNWVGFVVTVFVVAPLVGLLLDRALFRWMRTASWQVKLVSALGLLVAFPEIVKAIFARESAVFPPSLAGFIGLERTEGWQPFGYTVGSAAIMIIIFTVLAVLVLGVIFRWTAIGLQMRAVVESPRMVELAGVDADRVSMVAWMLSSVVAGLAGILLAPEQLEINGTTYTLLIVAAITSAAIGRFTSIPATFAGAIAIGIFARALPDIVGSTGDVARNIRPSAPFIILFLLMVLWPKLRAGRAATDPLAGVDPPPPAMAHEYKDEQLRRFSKIAFPVFIVAFLAVMMTLVSSIWVNRITEAFVYAVIFLSITIFTGFGGQISLAQASFASVGAFTVANLFRDADVPALVAWVIGALFAAAVGAIFVLLIDGFPSLIGRITNRLPTRLSGLYLSLATLAFALMLDKMVFSREDVVGGDSGLLIRRPDLLHGHHVWFLTVFGVFCLVGLLVILLRKGTTGRYLAALRGSDPAAASIGINATGWRIMLFALAAGVAGLGGGLLTLHNENAAPRDTISILGIVWVVLVVTLGSRTVDGAANAALGLIITQWLLEALGFEPDFAIVFFGLGAITYARHPEGIVEFQTRKSVLATQRQRALNARANELSKQQRIPSPFLPTIRPFLAVFAGPLLYFVYVLVRSALEDGWVHVHTWTLLAFIGPSLLYGLAWMLRTDASLRRIGGIPAGGLMLFAGAGAGALVGWFFDDQGWPVRHDLTANVLVGAVAGFAFVGFFVLPSHVARIARARGWLTMPITWHAGRAPAGFILFGALLFERTTLTGAATGSFFERGSPPSGWPVFLLLALWTIVWSQWVSTVQGACNELAIGGENFQPPEEKAFVASRDVPVVAPVGGAT